jgi:hypothetical protein
MKYHRWNISHKYSSYKLDQENAHNLLFHLQNSYIFRTSLALHQRVQMYKTIARPYYHLQYSEIC